VNSTWVAGDVLCAVRRGDDVLAALPVADVDAVTAEALPAWRVKEFLAARTLLRSLLAELVGAPHEGVIGREDSGRPWLPGLPGVGVSLSHSAGWIAAAASRGREVGVDVQVPISVSQRLIARCRAEGLLEVAEPRRATEFAWVWSAQEACVKATGQGIGGLPWTVPVAVGQDTGDWGPVRWTSLRGHSAVPVSCAYTMTAAS
jgi:4'-phosphopantetheinyl transferase